MLQHSTTLVIKAVAELVRLVTSARVPCAPTDEAFADEAADSI